MTQSTPPISILLPTRGRTEQLARSVASLVDLADKPDTIQWLFGFDTDDTESFEYFQAHVVPMIQASGGRYTCLGFAPLGYHRLNEYVNRLAQASTGDWMVFWNDDAVMKTQGWDTVIAGHTGRFCLQAFDTHKKHPYSIFPIVPRKWLEIIGHLSLHQLNDAWLSQIAWLLDIMVRIDVEVEHERYDLTGKNNDATFQQRQIFEGNPRDPRDFNHETFRKTRIVEAGRIAYYLHEQGYDLTYWENVVTGRQDPWAKMLEADVNKQMTKLDIPRQ